MCQSVKRHPDGQSYYRRIERRTVSLRTFNDGPESFTIFTVMLVRVYRTMGQQFEHSMKSRSLAGAVDESSLSFTPVTFLYS